MGSVLRFVVRTALYLTPVLLAVTLLTTLLGALMPGDVATVMLGSQATPENVEALRTKLGLNLPVWQQYLRWVSGVLHGDFGHSVRTGEDVLAAVMQRFPVTLEVILAAQVLALAIGVPAGVLAAARPGSWLDRMVSAGASAMLSMPSYMLALVLIYGLSLHLQWLPASGFVALSQSAGEHLKSLALPALTLALVEWPALARVLRADMVAALKEDYIMLARAKGLSQRRILFVHAFKPASIALVTMLGLNLGRLVGATVVVEAIFSLPGIGQMLVDAIYTRDFVTLQGCVVFVTLSFVFVNLAADQLVTVLDPRVRRGEG